MYTTLQQTEFSIAAKQIQKYPFNFSQINLTHQISWGEKRVLIHTSAFNIQLSDTNSLFSL